MNDAERVGTAPPDRIAAIIGHGMPTALVSELAVTARFASRLQAVAADRLGTLPPLNPRQVAALALDADGFRRIVLGAGAIWHAAALARVVDGNALRGILAALGPVSYAWAMEARALAPTGLMREVPSADDLAAEATTEGEGCWAAWRKVQPAPVAMRLSLLDGGVVPRHDHVAFGPPILDWLLDRA